MPPGRSTQQGPLPVRITRTFEKVFENFRGKPLRHGPTDREAPLAHIRSAVGSASLPAVAVRQEPLFPGIGPG